MKYRKLLFLMVAISFFAGCSTTSGVSRTQNAAIKVDDIRVKTMQHKDQVAKTVAALNLLPGLSGKDLRKQFNSFAFELKRTEEFYKKIGLLSERLNEKKDVYLSQWAEELQTFEDAELKTRSEQRLKTVREEFTAVIRKGSETKTTFDPYLSYLRQIRKYLSLDLTPQGVSSISDLIQKANDEVPKITAAIEDLASAQNELFSKLNLND